MNHKKYLILAFIIISLGVNAQTDTTTYFKHRSDSLLAKLKDTSLNDTTMINLLVEIGVMYNATDVSKSLEYINRAEKLEQRTPSKWHKGKIHFTYGHIYLNKAQYQTALFHYLMALRIFDEFNNSETTARCLHNIGVIYTYLNNLTLAEKYFKDALALKEKNKLFFEMGIAYTGLGYISEMKKDYPKALEYYKKTLASGQKTKDKYTISIAYTDLGSTYLKLQQKQLANKYFLLALRVARENNDIHSMSNAYISLSEIATMEKNYEQAERYLKLAENAAKEAGMMSILTDSYKRQSELFHLQGLDTKAYTTRLIYEELNDSALNKTTYEQVNNLQATYEIEKKNNEITLLNKDKEIAMEKISKNLLLRNILILTCILVLIIAGILLRNVSLKQRLNKTLSNQNKQLVEENITAKYEVLKSRINPHFLFNSLNTLTSIIESDKSQAIEFIEHFSELFRQILESGDLDYVSLKDEISTSQNYIYLQKVRFGNKLHIDFEVNETDIYYLPSFSLQMVIENAIKHNSISAAKNLYITIRKVSDQLMIENNLQPKSHGTKSTKIGQLNITERYRQYSSILPTFEQTDTHYKVTLPLIYKPIS